ncbi:MAG: RidA family protein [Promethearchaeota archaeon]|nr:MAG: RidA family protein [Candidatus Lokiarchaeota archaeon]
MTNKEIIPIDAPKAGPYNHGVKVGNLLFLSGQIAGSEAKTIQEQTLSIFKKIKTILEAANANVSDIVKVTVFLKDVSEFKEMNAVYQSFFEDNGVTVNFPARTTVEVSDLPLPNLKLEIDVIASI